MAIIEGNYNSWNNGKNDSWNNGLSVGKYEGIWNDWEDG